MNKPIEVLHIEDDADHVDLVRTAATMAKLPLKINCVPDGEKALQYLRNQDGFADAVRPDLIILDITLSEMDGWEALKAIRENPELGKVPIVVLTNRDLPPTVLKRNSIPHDNLFRKPVGINGYIQVMKAIGKAYKKQHNAPHLP